ncbi:hypothetical protein [Verrucomicrobium spinosum]|uniref:hypothetical protein n=1 Tax=Verrucomicrobium spinosum TaxID=2736 RepID=UPI00017462D7|nr:hypothetical protein [Verrucomicrobium spinosum]
MLNTFVLAQDQSTVEPTPRQVLQQITYFEEGRKVTLQRIAPPLLPTTQQAEPAVAAPSPPEPPGPEKSHHLLVFSVTVYDGTISVLDWIVEGRKYRAQVNADMADLAGVGVFETTDAAYSILFGLGKSTSEELTIQNAEALSSGASPSELVQLPALDTFPAGYTSYQLSGPAPSPAHLDADCQGLEDLLAYYDTNKLALQQARQQRETEQAAREQWLKDHPPAPKDTVIQIWPIKSSRHQTGGTEQ